MIHIIKFWLEISNLVRNFIIGLIIHIFIFILILIFGLENKTFESTFILSFFTNLLPWFFIVHTIVTICLFYYRKKIIYHDSLKIACVFLHIFLSVIYSIWLSKKIVFLTSFFGEYFDFYSLLFITSYLCIQILLPSSSVGRLKPPTGASM